LNFDVAFTVYSYLDMLCCKWCVFLIKSTIV